MHLPNTIIVLPLNRVNANLLNNNSQAFTDISIVPFKTLNSC